jgi:pyruvate dehydrogenase E1 component
VDRFGESGTIAELHELTGIDAGSIVNAALLAVTGADVGDDDGTEA